MRCFTLVWHLPGLAEGLVNVQAAHLHKPASFTFKGCVVSRPDRRQTKLGINLRLCDVALCTVFAPTLPPSSPSSPPFISVYGWFCKPPLKKKTQSRSGSRQVSALDLGACGVSQADRNTAAEPAHTVYSTADVRYIKYCKQRRERTSNNSTH